MPKKDIMELRPAEEKDIPSIVSLLKLSLGESLMPKSEMFWRWKHIENPFGPSPVLLAWEGEQLIGVRAFMRWEWSVGDKVYKSVRAVDTATHPQYHGRGIFKNLTMKLVDQCRIDGVDFIFNTPNKISKPGYLKMGWESNGKLPVKMKLHWLKSWHKSPTLSSDWSDILKYSGWQVHALNDTSLKTRITPEYLFWRYRDNPNVTYQVLINNEEKPFVLIYRKKKLKLFVELRITDLLCEPGHESVAIRCLQTTAPTSIVTISGCNSDLKLGGFITMNAGPEVTVRNLNLPDSKETLTFGRWAPSLGDLELF